MSLFGALNICEEILSTKKYASLHRPLVLRVCEDEYKKYTNDRDRIKATKNTLHAIYGAFLSMGIYKKADKFFENHNDVLRLHASTRERLHVLPEFYGFIFENIGQADSILDIGCGFNPFSMPYFPTKPKNYHALDIDSRIADLNNRYFESAGLPPLASCVDVALDTPKVTADAAFLFKLLPLIDRQNKGRSANLIREIDARFLVITYPTKSLTGKEKGMKSFYAASFEEVIGGNLLVFAKKQIGDELVYIVSKK